MDGIRILQIFLFLIVVGVIYYLFRLYYALKLEKRLASFAIVSNKDKSICPMATLTSDFRYIWISPVSRQKRIIGFTSVILATTPIPHRLILSPRASIAAPESSVHYKAITLGDTCFRWRFPPPYQVSLPGNSPT